MKNIILKGITGVAFVLFLLSASCLDSENFMPPMIVMLVSFAWLALMAEANKKSDL